MAHQRDMEEIERVVAFGWREYNARVVDEISDWHQRLMTASNRREPAVSKQTTRFR